MKRMYDAGKQFGPGAVTVFVKRKWIPKKVGQGYVTSIPRMPAMRPAMRGTYRRAGYYGRYNQPGGGNEIKFFDTSLSFLVDASGEVPATGQLCLIPQGVTESTRVGRKATIKSIQLRMNLRAVPAAGATYANSTYLYVVLDKQANGAAAAVTDIFTTNSLGEAMLNMANSSRFTILKKWVMDWNPAAGATGAYNNAARHIEWFHKCNIPLEYSSTTGALTELKSNNVFLVAGAAANDDTVSVAGAARLRFDDD